MEDITGGAEENAIEEQQQREAQWADGEHTTSAGKVIKLTDMPLPHLQNTINKFDAAGYDTTPLQEELKGRTQN